MVDTSFTSETIASSRPKNATSIRSDIGTIILHWLTVVSMIVSLLTGLRISADGLDAGWAKSLAVILPQGEVWTWHVFAGLALSGTAISYWLYMKRAALTDRNAISRLNTLTPPTSRRLRLKAINVALHWLAYIAIALLLLSGGALFLGFSSWFLTAHNTLAWTMVIFIIIHTVAHFLYGGLAQLLRLFRYAPLTENARTRVWPLGLALTFGALGIFSLVALDWTTRSNLTPAIVNTTPALDGSLNEPMWQQATSTFIQTHQGANLGGTGSSTVEMKVAITDKDIHFAFRWQDPTRSLMRSPLVKTKEGWRIIATGMAQADVNDYYEDKFAVLFSNNDGLGGGESTFLGDQALENYPKSPHGRGLHYTTDGRLLDLWQWKSSRGGMLGHVDDMHFGPPKKPDLKQRMGMKRYAAGYDPDPGTAIYEYNYIAKGPKGYLGPIQPKRVPVDLAQLRFNLGVIPHGPDDSNDQGSRWWMTMEDSVPWSADLDRLIPSGTIMPSTLNIKEYQGDRADLSGGAKWEDGYWTMEVSRARDTGSPYDITFHPGQRVYVWASVFDHNQTRHTRHQRAVVLDLP